MKSGADRDRTDDLLNAIQALSQTELQPHNFHINSTLFGRRAFHGGDPLLKLGHVRFQLLNQAKRLGELGRSGQQTIFHQEVNFPTHTLKQLRTVRRYASKVQLELSEVGLALDLMNAPTQHLSQPIHDLFG